MSDFLGVGMGSVLHPFGSGSHAVDGTAFGLGYPVPSTSVLHQSPVLSEEDALQAIECSS